MRTHRRQLIRFAGRLQRLVGVAGIVTSCTSGPETSAAESRPAAPDILFTVDLWPGEGIPVIETRRPTSPLRAAPDLDSPEIDTLGGPVGRRLVFDSTSLQTIETGTIRVLTTATVRGRDIGDTKHLSRDQYYHQTLRDVVIPLVAPTTIEYLQDRAEGTCFVRVGARVIDANPCPAFSPDSVLVERQPVTRWWIRVRGQGGAFGWIIVSDSTAQSVRREF